MLHGIVVVAGYRNIAPVLTAAAGRKSDQVMKRIEWVVVDECIGQHRRSLALRFV